MLAGVVLFAFWRNGAFLPSWVIWDESVDATDTHAGGVVESVVLKERALIAYSGGSEIYRTPSEWKAQDAVWQDMDGNGAHEIILLYWRRGNDGSRIDTLTGDGGLGMTQHIAVFDGISAGMHLLWDSGPLSLDAVSFRADANNRLIISGANGEQILYAWNGAQLVSAGAGARQAQATADNPAGEEPPAQDDGASSPPAGDDGNTTGPAQQGETEQPAAGGSSSVTFLAVGDDLPHPMVFRYGVNQTGGNYDYLFQNVAHVLQTADFAVLNQETVFVKEESEYSGYPTFGSPLGIGEAAIRNGFNIFTCATNHTMDKGLYGLETTADFFATHSGQVTYLGTYQRDQWQNPEHEIRVISKNGISFALLNYTYGLNGIPIPANAPYSVDTYYYDENWYDANLIAQNEAKMRADIRRAKELADVVIFFPHWGTEYRYTPDNYQQRWTQILLEEGVDIVVGTHPHVVEPVEMLVREDGHEMLVYYSLGNFISGQDEPERVLGGMAQFTVTKKDGKCSVTAYDMLPVITHQEAGGGPVSAYMYTDYTADLAARHVLGLNPAALGTLYRNIVDWKAQ